MTAGLPSDNASEPQPSSPSDSTPTTSSPHAYSHGHHASVLASHGVRTAEDSCAYFLDRLRPGDRVLDIGCGPGSITLDLARRVGPEGSVVGIDAAAPAVDAARAAARERGDVRTRFEVADAHDPSVELDAFDVVHAHQVLQHVTDPVGLLRRMAALCRPGGLVVARDADYGAMTWYPPAPGLDAWRSAYSAAARTLGHQPDAGRRLRQWANAAGLSVVWAGSSTWTYATEAATDWWGRTQARRVRESQFAQEASRVGCSAEEIEAMAAGWEDWAADPDAWFAMVHGEIIATRA